MADNYVFRIATARRIGGAHRKVRDVTARLSDMKEREGVINLPKIFNVIIGFSLLYILNFHQVKVRFLNLDIGVILEKSLNGHANIIVNVCQLYKTEETIFK